MRAAEAGPSGPDAAGAPAPAPPSTRPAPADGDSLQSLAATLRSSVDDLFSTHVELTALDLDALRAVNTSASVFYRGLAARAAGVAGAADAARAHADAARRAGEEMRGIAAAARRVEALVERLDEYTEALEGRLRTRPSPASSPR